MARLLLALALVAAACGSSGSGDSANGGTDSTDQQKIAADVAKNAAAGIDSRSGTPVRGGKLVYGIEADSANPWVHYATSCAISCRMIFRAISDPLFITKDDGTIVPYLVDKVTPAMRPSATFNAVIDAI